MSESDLQTSPDVFVAVAAFDYEGQAYIGAFSTLDMAKAACDEYGSADEQSIYAEVLDGPTVFTVERECGPYVNGKRTWGGWHAG